MAKGIPLMGRDPDGKAKIINVDENGNVKVQHLALYGLRCSCRTERPPANSAGRSNIYGCKHW